MKEITMVVNLQVTKIFKNVPDCFRLEEGKAKEMFKAIFEESVEVDDVQVKEIQQFIMDK